MREKGREQEGGLRASPIESATHRAVASNGNARCPWGCRMVCVIWRMKFAFARLYHIDYCLI